MGSAFDRATAVAMDAAGNVVAAGVLASSFAVVKFDGESGAELWRQAISGTGSGTNGARAVAVDGAGDIVAAGSLTNATLTDFAVIKFAGANGAERWRRTINGLANSHEEARTVAIDAVGDVIAAGSIADDFNRDFSVVKFVGLTLARARVPTACEERCGGGTTGAPSPRSP
jgi:outer membrane protein assembly factor BamB